MKKKPGVGSSLIIRSGQLGGAVMVYDGVQDGDFLQVAAGGALVAGPYFLAKMAAHPLGAKLMSSGIRLKPGNKGYAANIARMVNLSRQIDRDNSKRTKKATIKTPSLSELRGFGGRGF